MSRNHRLTSNSGLTEPVNDRPHDLPINPVPRSALGAGPALRVSTGLLLGVAAGVVTALVGYPRFAFLIGWDVAAMVFTVWTWILVWPFDATLTASHATREEPARNVAHLLILGAAVGEPGRYRVPAPGGTRRTSLPSSGGIGCSRQRRDLVAGGPHALRPRICTAVLLRPRRRNRFQSGRTARYSDFAYVAYTVGMSFAISDTNLKSSDMRAMALGHALLSYLFGSVIVASVVNLIAGL